MTTDYYKVLGVPRSATESELKTAFRKGAKESHPDLYGHLSPEERAIKEARFKNVNDAWEVLSDTNKKKEYDRELERSEMKPKSAEGSTKTSGHAKTNNEGGFGDIFKDMGNFGDIFKDFGNFGSFGKKTSKYDASFVIPENDWGLFAALKTAYASKEDGKWRVKKAESDTRDWMPETLYSVVKQGDHVQILRKITDWRDGRDRDSDIEVIKKGSIFEREKIKAGNFIGEYYLFGEGRRDLVESYNVPSGFGDYINALKSLAKKLADKSTNSEGKYDVQPELSIINTYGEFGSMRYTKTEKGLWKDDKNRELVKEVKFENFWNKLEQAEGRVTRVEGVKTSPEGQRPQGGPGGEARG